MVNIVSLKSINNFHYVASIVGALVVLAIVGTGVVNGVVPEPSERILTIVEKDYHNVNYHRLKPVACDGHVTVSI